MKKLWIILIAIFVISFSILGWVGIEIFRQAPPVPREVVSTDGQVLIPAEAIMDGQNVWQAMGGMQVGSIWGHGSYVAPDWTADYLHREAVFILNNWANSEFGAANYESLNSEQKAVLRQRLQDRVRKNNYDAAMDTLTIEPIRAAAFEDNLKHYSEIFTNGNKDYAIQRDAQSDPVKLRQMNAFFFWTAWASAANRPDNTISYTSNFPHEPLVGNTPTDSAIYLSGGIVGTLHHLYFAGTPTIALAFGSVFSALEIVPLLLVGYEATENLRHAKARPWLAKYKWVVYFFVAVAFWNLLGAGVFGFMVNPPIALYYMQGLNTTAVHVHGALYGVYGTLGLGLMLFCLRAMKPLTKWKEKTIWFAFWAINIGMLLELLLSLLPVGLMQTYQSVSVGYWSARSSEFMQTDIMQTLRWMRMIGDTIFAVGAIVFVYFALDLIFLQKNPEGETIAELETEAANEPT